MTLLITSWKYNSERNPFSLYMEKVRICPILWGWHSYRCSVFMQICSLQLNAAVCVIKHGLTDMRCNIASCVSKYSEGWCWPIYTQAWHGSKLAKFLKIVNAQSRERKLHRYPIMGTLKASCILDEKRQLINKEKRFKGDSQQYVAQPREL